MNEKLLDYIERQSKKGYAKEQIVDVLNRAGYDLKLIELHFEHIFKKNTRNKIFVSSLVAVLLITASTFYFYKSGKINFKFDYLKSKDYCDNSDLTIPEFEIVKDANETIRNSFKMARRYYSTRDLNRALNEFKLLIGLRPKNPVFYFYLGNIYCQKGDYTPAIEHYEKAISLNKKNPFYYLGMARCLEKQGLHEKAVETLNISLYVNLNSTTP